MATREELYTLLGKYQELKHTHRKRNQECDDEALQYFIWQCNALERSSLTFDQVKDVLAFGVRNVSDNNREELECVGLREAMKYVKKLVDNDIDLTEEVVKELHTLLYVGASEDFKGQYRTDYITIPHARNLPPVRHISYYMNKLFEEYDNEMNKMDVIEKISIFHIKFENIHPFTDGNGQVGRLIINYQLMRAGYPFIALKVKNKKEYIHAFEAYHMELNDQEMYQLLVDAIADELEARIEILSQENEK